MLLGFYRAAVASTVGRVGMELEVRSMKLITAIAGELCLVPWGKTILKAI